MEQPSDYLRQEMGAELRSYQGAQLLMIVEPLQLTSPGVDRIIEEAVTLHLDKSAITVPVVGREVDFDGSVWEVDTVDARGVMAAITLLRYRT